jgi:hypothetical protein
MREVPFVVLLALMGSVVGCGSSPAASVTRVTLPPSYGGPTQGSGPAAIPPPSQGTPPPSSSDAAAEQLLSATLAALQQNRDEDAAVRAIVPYVHRSLLDATGAQLTTDVRQFSFKKAFGAAPLYGVPVKVTRTRPSNVTAIGFGATAERGRSVDYFVAKRDGQPGMPAPVTVFFPESGGAPKVSYLGSL